RPDMQSVEHERVPRRGAPVMIGPSKGGRLDDLRRTVHAMRLESRGRIRERQIVATAQPIPVERAWPDVAELRRPVALAFARERPELDGAAGADFELGGLVFGSPHAKTGAARPTPRAERRAPDGQTPGLSCPTRSRSLIRHAAETGNAGCRRGGCGPSPAGC